MTSVDESRELLVEELTGQRLWSRLGVEEAGGLVGTESLKEAEGYRVRLDLLYRVGQDVSRSPDLSPLVRRLTRMTQQALDASASSVLLLDDREQDLLFQVAEGEAAGRLKQARMKSDSGIAGWVVRSGQPLIVNDVRKDPRFDGSMDKVTGFTTRSIICVPLMTGRKVIGVIEVLNKVDGSDFSHQDLETLVSVSATAAMAIENIRLRQNIADAYKSTIRALAAAVDARDSYTRGHSLRVTEYALLVAESLLLSDDDMEDVEYGGILHDIGKIGIPDRILTKPGPLTKEERGIMQQHSRIGTDMLKGIPFLEHARMLVLHHHERYDGTGYPLGLKGSAIPIGARIIAVADAFDTMTTNRPYRPGCIGAEQAMQELRRASDTQFCPAVVNAFVSNFHRCHFQAHPAGMSAAPDNK